MLQEKRECFVNENIEFDKGIIRRTVCQDLPVTYNHEDKWYCILHYPNNNKHNTGNFNQVLSERVSSQQNDFSYVYFSDEVIFRSNKFEKSVNFAFAIFNQRVLFINSIFEEGASFTNSTFYQRVIFDNANFIKGVSFIKAIFADEANFGSSIFQYANFNESKFIKDTSFNSAIFKGKEDGLSALSFVKAIFEGKANFDFIKCNQIVYFHNTNFHKEANFSWSIFTKETQFTDCIFNENADFRKTEFCETSVYFTNNSFVQDIYFSVAVFNGHIFFIGNSFQKTLDLQNIQVRSPETINFQATRLRPNWFVNTDPSKFVFINIDWNNANGTRKNVLIELDYLTRRKISRQVNQLLSLTYWQLAVNAEENNRFEQASDFRRMAFECEWIAKKKEFGDWINLLPTESTKLKRRFSGSENAEDVEPPPIDTFGILKRFDFLHWFYRITSYYGESWRVALCMLLFVVLILFPFVYAQTDFQVSPKGIPLEVVVLNKCEITDDERKNGKDELVEEAKKVCYKIEQRSLGFLNGEAILHSLTAITFQDVEYRRPLSFCAEFSTILEKILAPLQAALLALAIRRKFMR